MPKIEQGKVYKVCDEVFAFFTVNWRKTDAITLLPPGRKLQNIDGKKLFRDEEDGEIYAITGDSLHRLVTPRFRF
jgi:hypothetical protein